MGQLPLPQKISRGLTLPPHMMILKPPSVSLLLQVPYILQLWQNAPYIVSYYPQSPHANFFARLFIHLPPLPPGWTNSPPLPRHTKKHILKCTFSKSLTHKYANLKERYNHVIKVQVTTKNNKKEDRLYMKSPTPEANNISIPRSGATWGKLNMTWPLKPVPSRHLPSQS